MEELLLDLTKPIVFFDIETTGLDTEKDRIVQFAALKYYPDGVMASLEYIINPGIPIPKVVSDIHGITNEQVENLPRMDSVAEKIYRFIEGADLAGYNAAQFDIPLLFRELERNGFKMSFDDVNVMDVKGIFYAKEPRTLKGAVKFYLGRDYIDGIHNAMVDIQTTVEVFNAQVKRYGLPKNVAEIISETKDSKHVDMGGKLILEESMVTVNFGKYKGQPLCNIPRGYLIWMKENNIIGPDAVIYLDNAIRATNKVW